MEICQFSRLLKFKVQASARKIMCTIFWDAEGVLLIDFCLTKWQLQGFITLTWFTNCMLQLKRSANESWPRCRFFPHDNKPAQRVTHWTGCFTWIRIWTNVSSIIFSWPGTKWLPSVSKLEETPPWTEIFDRWWAQVRDRRVAEGIVGTFLFYRHWKTLSLRGP